MRPHTARPSAPTPAERLRSILATAHSMTVVTGGRRTEVYSRDGSGPLGHIHLHSSSEAGRGHEDAGIPITLELTDIAPTYVRDRLRARVTITGLLDKPYDSESAESTCVEFAQALIEDSEGCATVTLEGLQETDVDPMASCEASMLTHLVDGHRELLPLLLRLVRQQELKSGMVRALPVALDRYGLTLRLEHPDTHHDVRLPFPTPVTDVDQAGPQIHALMVAARRSSHFSRLSA
ncbi:DUF2470 domain-containing protein [Streptomyces sp. Je 1-79]|uniref:DUF2470 domain-containing protein n=1 Tax=Streptomyces sp. Je 1-79 TaxID=2943847 RepID=UPI0021A813E7|nr:DUF2470 domain-containing protein [Streptomyces sp. Je 1-79]MCT4353559.1 DUF2470 domain-containing protein [Streptomyces sp. Je 1-79]